MAVSKKYNKETQTWEEVDFGGSTGASAYEVAVKNGFVGTEKEWLESLKGNVDLAGYEKTVDVDKKLTGKLDKVFTSPNGTEWQIQVSDEGVLTMKKIGGIEPPFPPTPDENLEFHVLSFEDFDSSYVSGDNLYLKGNYTGEFKNVEVPNRTIYQGKDYKCNLQGSPFKNNKTIEIIKFASDFLSSEATDFNDMTNLKKVINIPRNWTDCPGFTRDISMKEFPDINQLNITSIRTKFQGCGFVDLSSYDLKNEITDLFAAFSYCLDLEKGVTIKENVTSADAIYAGCRKLKELRIENKTIPFAVVPKGKNVDNGVIGIMEFNGDVKTDIYLHADSQTYIKMRPHACVNGAGFSNNKVIPITGEINRIAIFGDSITSGTVEEESYPVRLYKKLPVKNVVYNVGRPGATMENIYSYIQKSNLLDGVVIIYAGTNASQSTSSPQTMTEMTDKMLSALNTDKYIITTPIMNRYVKEVDDAYKQKYGEHYFSLNDWFTSKGENPRDYSSDGVHLNDAGAELLSQAFYEQLQKLNYILQ